MPPGRRQGDDSKHTFAKQLGVLVVTNAIATLLTIWVTQNGLRSDVRDINTRIAAAAEIQKLQTDLNKERADAYLKALDAMKAEIRMTQLDMQALRESLLKMDQQNNRR